MEKNKDTVSEKDIIALEQAINIDKKRMKQGWKFVRVNSRIKAFVPCDDKGEPTELGVMLINNILTRS